MIGKTITITVAAFAMMSQASIAAASPADPVGLASNRAALGMPIGTAAGADAEPCIPTEGVRIACTSNSGSSALAGGRTGVFVLLGAIAAIGLGVAAAAGGSSRAATSP